MQGDAGKAGGCSPQPRCLCWWGLGPNGSCLGCVRTGSSTVRPRPSAFQQIFPITTSTGPEPCTPTCPRQVPKGDPHIPCPTAAHWGGCWGPRDARGWHRGGSRRCRRAQGSHCVCGASGCAGRGPGGGRGGRKSSDKIKGLRSHAEEPGGVGGGGSAGRAPRPPRFQALGLGA